jgi:hypothetical protein
MRYRIIMLPFLGQVHITVTRWNSQLGDVSQSSESFVMEPDDGETEHLYSILAWLAGEVASSAG